MVSSVAVLVSDIGTMLNHDCGPETDALVLKLPPANVLRVEQRNYRYAGLTCIDVCVDWFAPQTSLRD